MTGGLRNPLCVALDGSRREEVLALARATAPEAGLLKVGLTSLHAIGRDIVTDVGALAPVFVDAKLHDIPAQVAGAVAAIEHLGAWCVTVHASGGPEMVRAAARSAAGTKVIAVTVLTSLDDHALSRVGLAGPSSHAVLRLAELALEAGADGLVCSAHEAALLRERFGSSSDGGPLLIVPGIRPDGSDPGDQKRAATPERAMRDGADIIVVGRPIATASDPGAAARALAGEAAAL